MTLTLPSDREIVMTRVFNAPRTLVFEAYTKPEHIVQWWGPRKYTTIVDKMDVTPGGVWRYIARAPDGNEHAFNGVYREIVPPGRLVSTFEFEGMPGHVAVETATFEEHEGSTKLTVTSVFQTAEDRDGTLQSGMEAGAAETWDRLAEHLATLAEDKKHDRKKAPAEKTADREIVITRVLNAPRELVFDAWTDPKHIGQWWGPRGFTTTIHEMDVKPGGVWRFIMHGPDGVDYKNRIVYIEIVKPERLVYTHGADEDADPGQFHVTVTFAEQGGRTKLTMRSLFPSAAERDRVVAFGAIEGGNQTLDSLEEHLAKM